MQYYGDVIMQCQSSNILPLRPRLVSEMLYLIGLLFYTGTTALNVTYSPSEFSTFRTEEVNVMFIAESLVHAYSDKEKWSIKC
uniref:Dolichyl-P-Glc:Glc(2)Man(9)GlcNAc(2)-PP-dolichol alpha-1,2-glucosyltransferase n=1 Tax=Heterorhabditis bacteriophora TaxID=37862 RepID=A0A1I7XE65_HETBA